MPRSRPATTGYERLANHSDDSDDDFLAQSYASLQPPSAPRPHPPAQARALSGGADAGGSSLRLARTHSGPPRRPRAGSAAGVDLKAINARLERWADEIASHFRRSRARAGDGADEEHRHEIHHSVFQAPEGVRPIAREALAELPPVPGSMARPEFEAVVDSVRTAIREGTHPRMISQGSSGSYFARNTDGKVVGVFKPKDEEPYAAGNPKWNKWIHRNLFPCCFGRACLIPNLSYVSEAAAYTLDCQLRTGLVPYTDVVYLSSKSFHYPFWDRHSFSRRRKPLPSKPGSFQVFLKGFRDANIFLREHPWPDQYLSGFRTTEAQQRRRKKRWSDNCRPGSAPAEEDAESLDGAETSRDDLPPGPDNFLWTESLKESFREQLERLVILDYIMRNTDRGLDNWMIKVDWEGQSVSIASDPAQMTMETVSEEDGPRPVDLAQRPADATRASYPYKAQKPMNASTPPPGVPDPPIMIGAIDNSLSWPWKHPDAWRSFPFGWLFLPVDLIGRPFSQKTRDHFLPLLTSTHWWSQTQLALRKVFQIDPDFQERMFARQMAVMKGQAWNVVETLKTPDHGPLELTRRAKVCVWDDLVDVPVAVPMRATSSELHRHRRARDPSEAARSSIDEVDIGAAIAPSAEARRFESDLLGLGGQPAGMPNPGRFELTTSPSGEGAQSPEEMSLNGSGVLPGPAPRKESLDRPGARTINMSGSYQGSPRPTMHSAQRQPHHQRRYSFMTAATRRVSNSIAQQLYGTGGEHDDDVEGDLGYAAAEGMEGNQRKVIVERLEPVKSKNPVFTWC